MAWLGNAVITHIEHAIPYGPRPYGAPKLAWSPRLAKKGVTANWLYCHCPQIPMSFQQSGCQCKRKIGL